MALRIFKNAICSYSHNSNGYCCYYINVFTAGTNTITQLRCFVSGKTLEDIQTGILTTLKNNGFKPTKYSNDFGVKWLNIYLLNVDNSQIENVGFKV